MLIYDATTGAYKRGWGGHGMPLSEISNEPIPPYKWTGAPPPPEKNFVPDLHFVEISRDREVYIGERGQNRIRGVHHRRQVPARVLGVAKHAGARRGVRRAEQREDAAVRHHLQAGDLARPAAEVPVRRRRHEQQGVDPRPEERQDARLDRQNGRYAGMLHWINAVAMDSKGNIYTGEVEHAKRIQKFVPTAAR